jgi:cytochrome oxidase Cu insertion factor (SCO1/SenC/PrrC family)
VSRSLALAVLAIGLSLLPAAAADDALDDLLFDLQIVPLGDQVPPPFTLESVDGKSVSLAGLRGRAAFLYFWESG